VSQVFGGSSGGRVDFAQGGGPNVDKVSEAEKLVFKIVISPTAEEAAKTPADD
jgi:alanyl-tRNA synthetase